MLKEGEIEEKRERGGREARVLFRERGRSGREKEEGGGWTELGLKFLAFVIFFFPFLLVKSSTGELKSLPLESISIIFIKLCRGELKRLPLLKAYIFFIFLYIWVFFVCVFYLFF